jgi:membrane protein CcdC involved in cytochrome C biogenesis
LRGTKVGKIAKISKKKDKFSLNQIKQYIKKTRLGVACLSGLLLHILIEVKKCFLNFEVGQLGLLQFIFGFGGFCLYRIFCVFKKNIFLSETRKILQSSYFI